MLDSLKNNFIEIGPLKWIAASEIKAITRKVDIYWLTTHSEMEHSVHPGPQFDQLDKSLGVTTEKLEAKFGKQE